MGRLVAEAMGRPLPDVTRKMRTSKGFVATGLEARAATALAERVEESLGAPVLVIPVDKCADLPPLMRMRDSTINEQGIHCEAYTWNETLAVRASWDKVFLVSCGRLEIQETVHQPKENSGRRKFGASSPPNLATRTHHEFLMDVVLFEPWRRLRLDQNPAAFSLTEMERDPGHVLGPLYRSSMSLRMFAVGVPMNRGVALLATGGDDSVWESLTFLNKRDFDSYTYWLMQLVRFDRPIPA